MPVEPSTFITLFGYKKAINRHGLVKNFAIAWWLKKFCQNIKWLLSALFTAHGKALNVDSCIVGIAVFVQNKVPGYI